MTGWHAALHALEAWKGQMVGLTAHEGGYLGGLPGKRMEVTGPRTGAGVDGSMKNRSAVADGSGLGCPLAGETFMTMRGLLMCGFATRPIISRS